MPFYEGNKLNVIPVYENSYFFEGYVAQGLWYFFTEKFVHYFFIGDDLVLNPVINERNYTSHLHLENTYSFLPTFLNIHDHGYAWPRVVEAYHYDPYRPGLEIKDKIPRADVALQSFKKHGLSIMPLQYEQVEWKRPWPGSVYDLKGMVHHLTWKIKRRRNKNKKYHLPYPLVGGYSDIFVVSSASIKKFCHYCGLFAATNLFVELSIPTALVLSSDKIITEKELALKGRALWSKEDFAILEKYDHQLTKLLDEFPGDYLYLHPVKLSQWKYP